MAAAPTRRAWREAEKKKTGLRWAALAAAGFIVVGGGGLWLVTQNESETNAIPSSCDSTQRVSLVAEQAMADVLANKPVDGESCIQLDITSEPSTQTAVRASSGELSQPLWIPDSSSRVPSALMDDAVSVHTDSLASSPGVVVGQGSVEADGTWTDVVADQSTRMGNPDRDGGAHLALLSVASEVTAGDAEQTQAAEALTPRAQTQGVNSPILSGPEMLAAVDQDGDRAIVSERDYLDYAAQNDGADLAAAVPGDGTSFLDYPLLASGDSLESNDAVRTAADEISQWLGTDEGKQALSENNLRTADGEISNDSAVQDPARLPAPNEDLATTIVESYRNQAAPMNALVALDASGSMGTVEANGQSRWDTTIQTLMLGSQLFPARDSMGVWLFSDDLGGDTPYEELVPTRGMEEGVDGQTQREVLQSALAQAQYKQGGQTNLYETALAAFRNQQENYQDGQLNIVLLVSDGAQEVYKGDSMSLEEVTADLQNEQDPNRPVVIVALGISPNADAEALTAIAESTGGSYHPATTPEELQAAFVEALSANDPGSDPAQGAQPEQG
ncbi:MULTISPECIES: VWA domain-containing protein [Kocuria]|uniref:VWA domain-containing protein n=1 Tax=Kocuria subflava TaxID=1736139 RepID=A0A846TQ53_9MICC|nr:MULTISPECIES: VWA domain-containing protein [Kocuria]NKE09050.1 VWA domain-containing protein [Kocuria subflava]